MSVKLRGCLRVFIQRFSIAAGSFLFTCSAIANPVLGNVAAGQVSIQQAPHTTTINQSSSHAVINWQSFNIGKSEATHFQQPAGGVALNRISPNQGASQIYGMLTATGQIILMNAAGIYFGPSAYVNVGGLIATTANLTNQDFLNGNYHFTKVPGFSGVIENEGQLIAADHGLIALVAPGVINNGLIQANLGHVILASGDAYTINFSGNDLISFAIDAKTSTPGLDMNGNAVTSGVSNTGSIFANGGSVLITAQAAAGVLDNMINMRGLVSAQSVYQQNGDIVISGDPNAGVVNIAGTLDASGKGIGQTGGNVSITGYDILLNSPTLIDVSGNAGGGNILIGGNAHGVGPLPNANAVVMMPGVNLLADAISSGNGGNVVLWSDYYTQAHGNISAQGGALSGNGGYVETSAPNLDINGITVNTLAANGTTGMWLLDPYNVTINNNGSNVNEDASSSTYTPTASGAIVDAGLLGTALDTSSITISTANGGGAEAGNITFADVSGALHTNWIVGGNTLTLLADNNIAINNAITLNGGQTLNLTAGNTTAAGSITVSAAINGAAAASGTVNMTAGSAGTVTINNSLGATTLNSLTVNSPVTVGGTITLGTSTITLPAVSLGTNTLTVNDAAASTISGIISGSGGLTKSGAGVLTLSNTNSSYSGATIISAGTLNVATLANAGTNSSIGTGSTTPAISIGATGVLQYTGSAGTSTSRAIVLTGSGATIDASGTGALTFSGTVTGNTFGLVLTGTGSGAESNAINTTTGTVTKNGTGIWTLTSAGSTHTGANIINNGTLAINNDRALGAVPGAATPGSITFGGGTLETTATFTLNTNRGIALSNALGNGGTILTDAGTTLTYAGIIANGSGTTNSLTKAGTGTLTISGVNTYTGATTISAGTLSLGNNNALGGATPGVNGTSGVTVGVATLNFAFNNLSLINTVGIGTGASGASVLAFSGTNATVTNNITMSSGLTINGTGSGTLSGNLTGNQALTKSGTATITLSGSNALSGTTTISGGTLNLASTTALNGSTAATVATGSALMLTNVNYPALPLTLVGSGISSTGALLDSGASTWNGAITLSNATTIGTSLASDVLTLNGTIGVQALSIAGPGAVTLNNTVTVTSISSTAAATTNINAGITASGAAGMVFNGPVTIGADVTLNAATHAITFGNTINSFSSTPYSLTLNGTNLTTLSGIIGGINPLNNLTTNTGGTLVINTNAITTYGNQSYNKAVTLATNANKVFTSTNGSIGFTSTINGAFDLTLSGNTGVTLGGIVGGTTALSSLTTYGPTSINTTGITTSGNQTYNSAITPGAATTTLTSTAGNITLTQPTTWSTTDTLALSAAAGTLTLNAITATTGSLNLTASSTLPDSITPVAINVNNFNLLSGQWIQVSNSLLTFNVNNNFQIDSGTLPNSSTLFIRATGGNGSGGNPYIITDIYGLQGIASSTATLALNYQLGNTISAAPTNNWTNASGAGFIPIGTTANPFSGTFNGENDVINNLFINMPNLAGVGLFGVVDNVAPTTTISNIGLTNANITGGNQTGALIGSATNTSITNSFAAGLVTGSNDTGLLIGQDVNGSIGNAFSAGNVIGTNDVGGLVGDIQSNSATNTVTNSFSTANVRGTDSVGGLVGTMEGNNSTLTFSNVYSGGDVIGTTNVGGLVGIMIGDTVSNINTISNAYSTSNVTGSTNLGGLIGQISSSSGGSNVVNDTYSSGLGAGLIGTADASASVNNSFWDTQTSGQSTSAGGTGMTTAELMNPSTFSNAGWNIGTNLATNTWVTIDGQTRPVLAMESTFSNISSAHQLQLIGYNTTTESGTYTLVNDINASGTSNAADIWNSTTGFIPIGSSATPFTGTLNGNGNVVYNLNITNTGNDVGLFGYTSSAASISNIGVDGNITGGIASQYVGGLVGYNNGALSSVYSGANVTGNSDVGGLIGYNNSGASTIQDVYSYGNITGIGTAPNSIGGLIGYNNGNISFAYSSGLVSSGAGSTNVGGFIGTQNSGSLSNNFFDTNSSGQTNAVGYGSSTGITGATTTALLSEATYTGWNIGTNPSTNAWLIFDGSTRPMLSWEFSPMIASGHALQLMQLTNKGNYALWSNLDLSGTTNPADVWGTSSTSGAGFLPIGTAVVIDTTDFLGGLNGAYYTINDLYIYRPNTTKVGLFGLVADNTIQNVGLTNVNVTGANHTGGLIGYVDYSLKPETVTNTFVTGTVTATGSLSAPDQPWSDGGLIGFFGAGTLSNSYADVILSAPTSIYVGLLVGANTATISNSYSTGSVVGLTAVGGLVGWDTTSTISNSYSLASVTGTLDVGGLIGLNNGPLTNSFSTGMVIGSTNVGGLIGSDTGAVTNSYWNTVTSGQSTSAAGTGYTTAQMMSQSNYSGWDFTNTWGIIAGQSYPYLLTFYSSTPRAINGTSSAGGGVSVELAVNGVNVDSITTGADGSYYFLEGNNLISGINNTIADNSALLTYLTSGSILANSIALAPTGGSSISGLNMTANSIDVGSSTSESISNATLSTAYGSLSNPDILYSASGNNITLGNSSDPNIAFNTTANTTYNLNGNINSIGNASASSITFNGVINATTNASLSAAAISFINGLSGSNNVSVNGIGSNNSLTVQSPNAETFNINSANTGMVSGVNGYSGLLSFNNIQNLTGGTSGNNFVFANGATLGGTVNGSTLGATNTVDFTAYGSTIKILLSSTNGGVVQNSGNSLITGFANITNMNTNGANRNSLTTPAGIRSNVTITGGLTGYVNDPIFFNGVYTIDSSGGTLSLPAGTTFNPITGLFNVDGVFMSFADFANINGFTTTIPSTVASVSNVVQQPPTNASQNSSAPVPLSPAWLSAGAAVTQNMTTTVNDITTYFDNTLQKTKINPFCYASGQ